MYEKENQINNRLFSNVKAEMEKRMPNAVFQIREVKKANTSYTGLMLDNGYGNPCPVFAMPYDMTDAEVIKFCDDVEYHITHMEMPDVMCTNIFDNFEIAKEKLFVRAVNAENSKQLLEGTPHRMIGDIALIPYLEVDKSACTAVIFKLCEQWRISPDSILEMAFENAKKIKRPFMNTTENVMLGSLLQTECENYINAKNVKNDLPYVVTNEEMVNGASVVFYPEMLDHIAKMFNGNIWILPSSIHEVLVICADQATPYELYEIVKSINHDQVDKSEQLSDLPLYYNETQKALFQYDPTVDDMKIVYRNNI